MNVNVDEIRQSAFKKFPDRGTWAIANLCRKAEITLALIPALQANKSEPLTHRDALRADWLISVLADTIPWNLQDALDIVNDPNLFTDWIADSSAKEAWIELENKHYNANL